MCHLRTNRHGCFHSFVVFHYYTKFTELDLKFERLQVFRLFVIDRNILLTIEKFEAK